MAANLNLKRRGTPGSGCQASLTVLLSFALGEIENEASGRGPEFECLRLGQQRAKELVYWDRFGLASVGWHAARAMNRAIGEHSGLGNNSARGWVLALACAVVALSVGACGYYFTLSVGMLNKKLSQNKPREATDDNVAS